jgi:subtilisin family serine protease
MAKRGITASRPSARRSGRYVLLSLLLLALAAPAGIAVANDSPARYVVLFDSEAVGKEDPDARPAMSGSLSAHGDQATATMSETLEVDADLVAQHVHAIGARTGIDTIDDVYTSAVGGFAAVLTPTQLREVEADPAVDLVLADVPVSLEPSVAGEIAGGIRTIARPSVRVPPGVRRVGGRGGRQASRGQRVNADVAIIDTGVQRDHPDLNVVGGYNCTGRDRGRWTDNNGHGTHVAGIVGARDNSFGVTGVAPGARLWSVKVLDGRGRGFLSWVVCGVDWVSAQRDRGGRTRIEVANMSLSFSLPGGNDNGCGRSGDPLHRAVCRSVGRGTVYVVAAGNESRNAARNRPAAYDEVITVSAMADYDGRGGGRGRPSDSCPYSGGGHDDAFARFSNYGGDVDLIAPGTCVLSTFTGKRYGWMSGTSMAAPHVAGAAAIYRTRYRASPAGVRRGLMALARLDWRTGTDPDRAHEHAVWIGSFQPSRDRRGARHASSASWSGDAGQSVHRGGRAAHVAGVGGGPSRPAAATVTASRSTGRMSEQVAERQLDADAAPAMHERPAPGPSAPAPQLMSERSGFVPVARESSRASGPGR